MATRFSDAQFPIYRKLATPKKGGKELVRELLEAATGAPPSKARLNMWSSRGTIPPNAQVVILQYCAAKRIKAIPLDFTSDFNDAMGMVR